MWHVHEGGRTLAHMALIEPRLWHRLVDRILIESEFQGYFGTEPEASQREWAERILNESLGFLRLCAEKPGGHFGPSPLVDIGWHTFILYTRPYAAFCEERAGRFIHHDPSDEPGVDYGDSSVGGTIAAMQEHGIAVDLELWGSGASCSDYCKNSCSSSRCTDTG